MTDYANPPQLSVPVAESSPAPGLSLQGAYDKSQAITSGISVLAQVLATQDRPSRLPETLAGPTHGSADFLRVHPHALPLQENP